MILRTCVFLGAILVFSGSTPVGRAQDTSAKATRPETDSLGDAARKARVENKHSGKPAKVLTNDDMVRLKYTHSPRKTHSALAPGTDRAAETANAKTPARATLSGPLSAPSNKN